jgi:nickel-dependent lactate racemase
MPGLVAYETIREHHTVYTIQEGAYPGNTETNPFYREVSRVAGLANLNMILGALYTNQEKVFDVVAGHYYEAHQEGIRRCIGNFKVKMDKTSIVGASAVDNEIINIPDAYADERFNTDVDKQTGYTTKTTSRNSAANRAPQRWAPTGSLAEAY